MTTKNKIFITQEEFLKDVAEFSLGHLPTETFHPESVGLAEVLQKDINEGLKLLRKVDEIALESFRQKIHSLKSLHTSINETLKSGGRIFLGGCGATGRLSLGIEKFWRESAPLEFREKVIAFMAGGDLALIHSLESFEDFPSYGQRQLRDLKFQKGDLFIGITEGGETPFVIGATLEASTISPDKTFYLFCNPVPILKKTAKRCEEVLTNKNIQSICLDVGPMALAGSTRMQATTVLQLAAGLCLMNWNEDFSKIVSDYQEFLNLFNQNIKVEEISKLVELEAQTFKQGGCLVYATDAPSSLTVLTDTTERSPTFSLKAFENQNDLDKKGSFSYLILKETKSASDAWEKILLRYPRTLEWKDVQDRAGIKRLMGFDLSEKVLKAREVYLNSKEQVVVDVTTTNNKVILKGPRTNNGAVEINGPYNLITQTLLKIFLNTLSTASMGVVGRYQSNIMTWVRPSNKKLIDRSIRNVLHLLHQSGLSFSYERVTDELFKAIEKLETDESIVLKTFKALVKS